MATVLINRVSKVNKTTGAASLVAAPNLVQHIRRRYMDGSVQTTSGDVWKVKRHEGREADYVTVDTISG